MLKPIEVNNNNVLSILVKAPRADIRFHYNVTDYDC